MPSRQPKEQMIGLDTAADGAWSDRLRSQLRESAGLVLKVEDVCAGTILAAAKVIARSVRAGGKLMLCGNGGSAADAQHLAGEFVSRLTREFVRPPMPAVALTTDSSCLTAVGNDFGFEHVFERQVMALGRPQDSLLAISTSGRSENIILAIAAASQTQIATVALLGQGGGAVSEVVDVAIVVPSDNVQRIQEAHIAIEHILCDLVERMCLLSQEVTA